MVLNNSILLIVAVVLLAGGAFLGLTRGAGRSFLRLFTVLVAFVGSAVACTYFLGNTAKLLGAEKLDQVLDKLGIKLLSEMKTVLPEVYDLMIALPAAAVAPIVFTVLFFLVSSVLLLVYGIVAAFVMPKFDRKLNIVSHVVGAVLGVLQGAVILMAVMVPVVGLVDVAVEATDVLIEEGNYESAQVEQLEKAKRELYTVKESPVYSYASRFGAYSLSKTLMTYTVEGSDGTPEQVDLRRETLVMAGMYAHARPFLGRELTGYGKAQADALDKLVADIDESSLFPRITAGFLAGLCQKWYANEPFFGVAPPKTESELDSFFTDVYDVFRETTEETLRADLTTFADLFDLFDKHGIFAALGDTDSLREIMSRPEVLTDLLTLLESNPRTAALADSAVTLAVRALVAEYLHSPALDSEQYADYEALLTDIASSLNALDPSLALEERAEALAASFEISFAEYGLTEEQYNSTLLVGVAKAMLRHLGDTSTNATPEDVSAYFGSESFH